MAADLNLPVYFARIGYSGPNTPTLAVLRELCAHHSAQITFENLARRSTSPGRSRYSPVPTR
jgi:arylamine N-acetyltransferase